MCYECGCVLLVHRTLAQALERTFKGFLVQSIHFQMLKQSQGNTRRVTSRGSTAFRLAGSQVPFGLHTPFAVSVSGCSVPVAVAGSGGCRMWFEGLEFTEVVPGS